ncbi:oligosaccharyl transferase, archaeosortase A system-associated [Methanoregula formicica]|uniref:dolichyl-phosphooligosaccharide-protein glycotransferase n=1 Tax=Methanoregula formicica (strain DSM 22288 / NBRC 105244 / SMSP) TaxID=593750 RepID=L0HCI7_METFS|nr:oligosaccharyl transferase, archaeosortase A system-associated [Methanoregula formicica]AGB01521.1 putative membrane protein, required for N-linked glycosylation [Methanoregula formicica SMSP]
MTFFSSETNRRYLIGGCLVLFMGVAFVLRMIPAVFIPPDGFLLNSGADVWYTMRQIDVMVAHFLQYNWFDPMTAFPTGKTIDWGPLYPFLGAALSILFGASSRTDIVNIVGWISPILAALLVPVTYLLGKMIWNRMAGIVAAGLVSVICYAYFVQSSYGWADHNSAEVFFVALFFLAYLSALSSARKTAVDLKPSRTLFVPASLSCLAGILYFLGYLTSPTVILCLIIVAITTFTQGILDFSGHVHADYLLLVNGIVFCTGAILETLFGFLPWSGLSLTTYSITHVYVMVGLIAETLLLFGLAKIFQKNSRYYYLSLAGIIMGGLAVVGFIPMFQSIRDQAFTLLFGSPAYTLAVRETQAWSLAAAYDSFGLSLILVAGGLGILAFSVLKKQKSEQVFLLAWLVVMLLLTIPHQRFQLYLTVPAALTAAVCSSALVQISWDGAGTWIITRLFKNGETTGVARQVSARKERKVREGPRESATADRTVMIKGLVLVMIAIITATACVQSAVQDYAYGARTHANGIPKDWAETFVWLGSSTPPTGVDYFEAYDQQTFTYPESTYGILAPWEQGHRITYFSQRLPITNPFQDNLAGKHGVAAFYLSGSEEQANAILTDFKGRYVITDLGTATDTFPSLIPWITGSDTVTPYIYWAFVPDSSGVLTKTHLLGDAYFQTMIVRLQVFDGSLVIPESAQYTTYTIRTVPDSGSTAGAGGIARVISGMQKMSVSDSSLKISSEGSVLKVGDSYANFYSSAPYEPVKPVPALTHYRLVHESPTNISVQLGSRQGSTLPDIRLVKVFEYVKGAHISGEGVIELNLVTNTGRAFVYRQESSNGEFVVPYATEGSTTGVKATGPYHIVGTSRQVSVTEADVQNGSAVS